MTVPAFQSVTWAFLFCLAAGYLLTGRRDLLLLGLTAGSIWNALYPLVNEMWYLHPAGVIGLTLLLFALARRKGGFIEERHFLTVSLFLTVIFLASLWLLLQVPPLYATAWMHGGDRVRQMMLTVHQYSGACLMVPVLLKHWADVLRGKEGRGEAKYLLSLWFVNTVSFGTLFYLSLQPEDFLCLAPLAGFIITLPLCLLWKCSFNSDKFPARALMTSVLLCIPLIASVYSHATVLARIQDVGMTILLALAEGASALILANQIVASLKTVVVSIKMDALLRSAAAKTLADHEVVAGASALLNEGGLTKPQLWRLSEVLNDWFPRTLRHRITAVMETLGKDVKHES